MGRPKEQIPVGIYTIVYPQEVMRVGGHSASPLNNSNNKKQFGHEGEVLTVVDDQGAKHQLHLIPRLTKIAPAVGSSLFTSPEQVELKVAGLTFERTTRFKAILEVKPRQPVVSKSKVMLT